MPRRMLTSTVSLVVLVLGIERGMRMRRSAPIAVRLVCWLALAPATLGAENVNCAEDGSQTTRLKGHGWPDANQKHGASGTAEAYTLLQCLNPDLVEVSGTFIFSNVVPDNGGFNDIIQVGMGNCRASNCFAGMRYYSGWGRTSTTPGCNGTASRFPAVLNEGSYISAAA